MAADGKLIPHRVEVWRVNADSTVEATVDGYMENVDLERLGRWMAGGSNICAAAVAASTCAGRRPGSER